MAKQHFSVFHKMSNESIAIIEMDDSLMDPAADIIDPNTLTLRSIKNGSYFTLLPLDDHRVSILTKVKEAYTNATEKPAAYFSTSIQRMDALLDAVKLMFNFVEYIVVENKSDLDKIINKPKDEYTPKTVKYSVLGDLLLDAVNDAVNNAKLNEPPAE